MRTLLWGTEYDEKFAIGSGDERTLLVPALLELETGSNPHGQLGRLGDAKD